MSDVVHGGLDDRELDRLGRPRGDVVDLSANLHPDGPPPAVIEALRSAIGSAIRSGEVARYPSAAAEPLCAALAALHHVAPECVVVTPGASAAIYLAIAALIAPGERCAVFPPTFGEYERAIEAVGGAVVRGVASAPAFDLPVAPQVDMAVLCNPNNPTGGYFDRARVELLLPHTRHLLIDAAYEPLVEGAWDAVDLVRAGAPVVVIHSLTKLFAMPGVRLGYAVAPPVTAALLRRRQPPWPVGSAEIAVGLAAIAGIDDRRATVPALHERRRRIERTFASAGVRISASRTNFALAEVGDARQFRSALLARGFAVRDATSFGLPAWVRIAVPAAAAMDRLVRAIEEALAAMRETGR